MLLLALSSARTDQLIRSAIEIKGIVKTSRKGAKTQKFFTQPSTFPKSGTPDATPKAFASGLIRSAIQIKAKAALTAEARSRGLLIQLSTDAATLDPGA
jgi:hypothetical protein